MTEPVFQEQNGSASVLFMESRATMTGMETAELTAMIGERVRVARTAHGMSVGALADAAGIGKGSLSEIERGTRNPNLSTLYAIANALALPLSSLLAQRPGARLAGDGIEIRLLESSRQDDATVEVYVLELEPGATHRSDGHGAGVIEHLLVTSGRVRAGRADAAAELGAGESASWESDRAHVYAAVGGPASAVLVMRTPRG